MKPVIVIMLLSVFFVPVSAQGQEETAAETVFSDYLSPVRNGGFLHIPGLEFHSSMGFSYASSNRYGSSGMGYYMGHFDLRLSPSLTLRWDIGLRSTLIGPQGEESPEFFFPNVDLIYRPNDKFVLKFQYRQYTHPYHSYRYLRPGY